MGGEVSGPSLTDGRGCAIHQLEAGAPAGGEEREGGGQRREESPEVAAFHLCGGEGRDQQEEEAPSTSLGVGVTQNQTASGLGQVPYLLTLACAQDSRGFFGDPGRTETTLVFQPGGLTEQVVAQALGAGRAERALGNAG